jgi:hypothetical protein
LSEIAEPSVERGPAKVIVPDRAQYQNRSRLDILERVCRRPHERVYFVSSPPELVDGEEIISG